MTGRLVRCLMAGLLVCVAPSAQAALLTSCSVTTNTVPFGNYDPLSSASVDATGNIAVACTGLLNFLVSYDISLGTGGAGSFSPRQMAHGVSDRLNYNLYTTSARSAIWGDGNGGTVTVSGSAKGVLGSVTTNYTVYGRIPGGQSNVKAGSYSDSILVTVSY